MKNNTCASIFYCRTALENYEFENRQNKINSCIFQHFRTHHENSQKCAKFNQFQFEDLSTDKKAIN